MSKDNNYGQYCLNNASLAQSQFIIPGEKLEINLADGTTHEAEI